MHESDKNVTIGNGGWSLVVLAGVVTYFALRYFDYDFFPALVFALAIALVLYLLFYRLAVAINRQDDEEEAHRVRKIVPAST
mgnify:FL=1